MIKRIKLFGFNNVSLSIRKLTNSLSFPWLFINYAVKNDILINEINNEVRSLNKLLPQNDYDHFRNKIREVFSKKDCNYFLKNNYIQQIMFIGNTIRTSVEFFQIIFYHKRYINLLKEDKVGGPLPFWLFPKSSGNRIHHIYHLIKLTNLMSSKKLNDYDLIIEFGGGYGSYCRLTKLYGYKNDYLIFDFDDVNLMQYFYLKHFYENIKLQKKSEITITSDFDNLKSILNTFFVNKKILLVSHWAISETPLAIRESFFNIIDNKKVDAFIAFQEKFMNVDNLNYFTKKYYNKINKLEKFKVNFENHYYLFTQSNK